MVAALFLAFYVVSARFPELVLRTPDDASYYFGIAEHVADGRGFTFDGIEPTNGFQPLWLGFLVPLKLVLRGTPESFYRAGLVLQILILGAVGVLLLTLHRRLFPWRVGLVTAAAFVILVLRPAVNGLETAVQVGLLVLLLALGWTWRVFTEGGFGRGLAFGVLLGLEVLARLDMVFLVGVVAAVAAALALRGGGRDRRAWSRLAGLLIGAGAVVSPYLAWNVLGFGHLMPISGALKSSFPNLAWDLQPVRKLGVRYTGLALLAVAALLALARPRWRPTAATHGLRYFRSAVAVVAAAAVLHALYAWLFTNWAAFNWHYTWYGLLAALALSEPLAAVLSRVTGTTARLAADLALVGSLLVGGGVLAAHGLRVPRPAWHLQSYRAAVWARDHLPRSAVLAMEDAGIFGFFSRRVVVNLDGVVNDFAYQDSLRKGRLGAYLASRRVGYLVDHDFGDTLDARTYQRAGMSIFSHRYGVRSDPVTVRHDQEVYRSAPYPHEGRPVVFAIWRHPLDAAPVPFSPAQGRAGSNLHSLSRAASARSHDR
jgi:hypothetical protein